MSVRLYKNDKEIHMSECMNSADLQEFMGCQRIMELLDAEYCGTFQSDAGAFGLAVTDEGRPFVLVFQELCEEPVISMGLACLAAVLSQKETYSKQLATAIRQSDSDIRWQDIQLICVMSKVCKWDVVQMNHTDVPMMLMVIRRYEDDTYAVERIEQTRVACSAVVPTENPDADEIRQAFMDADWGSTKDLPKEPDVEVSEGEPDVEDAKGKSADIQSMVYGSVHDGAKRFIRGDAYKATVPKETFSRNKFDVSAIMETVCSEAMVMAAMNRKMAIPRGIRLEKKETGDCYTYTLALADNRVQLHDRPVLVMHLSDTEVFVEVTFNCLLDHADVAHLNVPKHYAIDGTILLFTCNYARLRQLTSVLGSAVVSWLNAYDMFYDTTKTKAPLVRYVHNIVMNEVWFAKAILNTIDGAEAQYYMGDIPFLHIGKRFMDDTAEWLTILYDTTQEYTQRIPKRLRDKATETYAVMNHNGLTPTEEQATFMCSCEQGRYSGVSVQLDESLDFEVLHMILREYMHRFGQDCSRKIHAIRMKDAFVRGEARTIEEDDLMRLKGPVAFHDVVTFLRSVEGAMNMDTTIADCMLAKSLKDDYQRQLFNDLLLTVTGVMRKNDTDLGRFIEGNINHDNNGYAFYWVQGIHAENRYSLVELVPENGAVTVYMNFCGDSSAKDLFLNGATSIGRADGVMKYTITELLDAKSKEQFVQLIEKVMRVWEYGVCSVLLSGNSASSYILHNRLLHTPTVQVRQMPQSIQYYYDTPYSKDVPIVVVHCPENAPHYLTAFVNTQKQKIFSDFIKLADVYTDNTITSEQRDWFGKDEKNAYCLQLPVGEFVGEDESCKQNWEMLKDVVCSWVFLG